MGWNGCQNLQYLHTHMHTHAHTHTCTHAHTHTHRLGIYTSSTVRTVAAAKQMLEQAAGCPLFEPKLVLYRDHTRPAPALHREVCVLVCVLRISSRHFQEACTCVRVFEPKLVLYRDHTRPAPALHREVCVCAHK